MTTGDDHSHEDDTHDTEPAKEPTKKVETTEAQIARIAREVTEKMLRAVGIAPDDKGEPTKEETKTEEKPKKRPSLRDEEDAMAEAVRREIGRVRSEEDHAKEHEKLKQLAEKPPATVRRLTRMVWGGPRD